MQEHPNKDPLGIVGTVVGNPSIRGSEPIRVYVFSHNVVQGADDGGITPGECYRYGVKMNYYNSGRKAVTVIVTSEDIKKRGKELLISETIKFLTEQADIIDRNAKGDYSIPWESENKSEAEDNEVE